MQMRMRRAQSGWLATTQCTATISESQVAHVQPRRICHMWRCVPLTVPRPMGPPCLPAPRALTHAGGTAVTTASADRRGRG
jgi:hypothetical protein